MQNANMNQETRDINPCENCKYLTDKYFHYYQDQTNENEKYTSTIITVGYISLISMLGQIYKHLNTEILVLIIVCATTSILFFTINEVWNMRLRAKDTKIINNIWNDHCEGKINTLNLIHEIHTRMQDSRKFFRKCYETMFKITLYSGLTSALLLLFGCLIFLTRVS